MRTFHRVGHDIVGAIRAERSRMYHLAGRSRAIERYLSSHAVRKLQLGTGTNPLPGWLNTDAIPLSRDVLYIDIEEPLPFENATLDRIFSEHLIEHITHGAGARHLADCCRVLRPGGILRIATPNLNFLIEMYVRGRNSTTVENAYIQRTIREAFPSTGFHHPGFVLNNFVRAWGHQFIYDAATLHDALSRAGFANVTRCSVTSSGDPLLQGLEHHGDAISDDFNRLQTMVFEATRPPAPAVAP